MLCENNQRKWQPTFQFLIFQKGVVIIDTPGIDHGRYIMDEIVTQYLPQAFILIYVINSANAEGGQIDRVSLDN